MGARTLVKALVGPAGPGTRHILTVYSSWEMSTAIEVDENGNLHVEHDAVVRTLGALLGEGRAAGLVLRTFGDEVAFTLPSGVDIPVKTVRGWYLAQGETHPLTEAEMFSAHCTDADSGEAIPPERGVVYADAWPVEAG